MSEITKKSNFPAPNPNEAFALGPKSTHGEAVGVLNEAGRITQVVGREGDVIVATPHSRELMKKIVRGEDIEPEQVFVSRTVIAQARENMDNFKPKEQ